MAAKGKLVRQIREMSLAAAKLARRTYLQNAHRMIGSHRVSTIRVSGWVKEAPDNVSYRLPSLPGT